MIFEQYLALSIWQPDAWLIAQGHKNVENRAHPTAVRGWVLIHAASHKVSRADWAAKALTAQRIAGIDLPLQVQIPRGVFVGAMRIDDCSRDIESPWFDGPWGYVIGARCSFKAPIEGRGSLDLFPVPGEGAGLAGDELAADIAKQIQKAGFASAVSAHNPATLTA